MSRGTLLRRLAGAGVAVAAATAFMPVAPAQADNVLTFSQDELERLCAGETVNNFAIADDCTFKPQSQGAEYNIWRAYGGEVSNCAPDARGDLTQRRDMSESVTETWSVGGRISINIKDKVSIEAGSEYSRSRTETVTVADTIVANPGYKNHATKGVRHVDQYGEIEVPVRTYEFQGGDGYLPTVEYHYITDVTRRVPVEGAEDATGQDHVSCGSDFRVGEGWEVYLPPGATP